MSISFAQAAAAHAMGGTFYDPARHELIEDNMWVAACVSAARANGVKGAENLFLYHHRLADTFVLAMWTRKPGSGSPPHMLELLVCGGPPGHEKYKGRAFDTPKISDVVERLAPAGVHAEKFRRAEEAEQDRLTREQVADHEAREKLAAGMERHDKGTADLIRAGGVPVAAGDDDIGASMGRRNKGRGNFTTHRNLGST